MEKREQTRKEYIKRINIAMDFIEKNLDKELSLALLSKKAFYSSFHFHRIFSAIVGETINTFINRKRIERISAILLVGTNEPLNELAFRYGFTNGSSFSRAFKKFHGISPTEFKTRGNAQLSKIGIASITLEKYICSINNIQNWLNMNAQIEVKELPEIKMAGIMHIGEFEKIGDTFQRLIDWAVPKGLLNTPNLKMATLYHDNPKVTEMAKVRLSACITVEDNTETEGDVRPIIIESGKYAVGHFEIKAESFQQAWDGMCIWVIENGYKFRDGEYFELYLNDHRTHPEQKFIVDICIPVD